ncbi:MAG: ABC transporter permease [Candidatus Dependentiae bacterium]|nr:ABC transporter permease [Candidatus Dependentiae bacterium]
MRFLKKISKSDKSFFFMAPAIAWQICFFFLPLLFVIQLSFCSDLFQNVSLQYFTEVIKISHFFVILRSLLLASVTASCCLLIGYPVAYYVALCAPARMKSKLMFLIVLPFLTNLLVQVYAWFFILEKHGVLNKFLNFVGIDVGHLLNSQFAMYLVMFHVYLPFIIMPLYSTLEKINIRLVESSLDLGASYFQTFCRVVLPLSLQGIKTGFFLVYVTSFGEYVIPSLIAGQKKYFVGTLISEYFFIGKDWHVGAAFTCLSSATFMISILIWQVALHRLVDRLQRA